MDEVARARRALKSSSRKPEAVGSIAEFISQNLLPGDDVEPTDHDGLLSDLHLPAGRLEELGEVLPLPIPSEPVSLTGYLACALTGLDDLQRKYVFQVSDAVAIECQAQGIELYEPRKVTDPNFNSDIQDTKVFEIDRDRVLNSDVLIFLSHFPSVGAGQELDFAYNAMIPIIVVYHSDARVSRMVTGIPGLIVKIPYSEPEQLRELLRNEIETLKPILQMRRLAFNSNDDNIVGNRIRQAREALLLTRAEIERASKGRGHITESLLKKWEESTDREFNPSLLQLRELAFLLRTNVATLVEPDMTAVHLSFINSLYDKMDDKTAARWKATSTDDRKRLLTRLIERLIVDGNL